MLSNSSVSKPLLSLGLCLSFWSFNDPSCECSLFAKVHVEEISSTPRVKWIIFILDHFNEFLNQTAAHMMTTVEFLKALLSNSSISKPLLPLGLCFSFWSVNDPSCECSLFAKEHVEEFSSSQRVKWIMYILDHINNFHSQTAAHMMAAVDCSEGECFQIYLAQSAYCH